MIKTCWFNLILITLIFIFYFPSTSGVSARYLFCPLNCEESNLKKNKPLPEERNEFQEAIENFKQKSRQEIPPPPGQVSIVINTISRTLTVFSNNEPYQQYRVAVGKLETPTPVGNWQIIRKATNWGSGFGSRWLGLNIPWGIYGIHGTNRPGLIGSYASHGCIRMNNKDVEQIYPWIHVGIPVIIIGNPFGTPWYNHKTLVRDDRGSDVMEVQRVLKRRGFYNGEIDGIYGWSTQQAVKSFRFASNLPDAPVVDLEVYQKLGL